MTCADLMTKDVAVCFTDERADVAARLMRDRNVGALVVIGRDRHPVGIVTDRDFTLSICANAEDSYYKPVKEVMRSPVVYCVENDDVAKVTGVMTEHHVRRVPIVDAKGALVGILSADDLARSLDPEKVKALFESLCVTGTINAKAG
jgi:CBS domain-containing protein